jgi:UDP-galactopyranose mutase
MYDWLIVGAGFAGAVLAERIASQRRESVLVIDRRPHIAGNAYDHTDAAGILIHQYGPHIFHTNAESVVNYLTQFTGWRPYEHRVLAQVGDKRLPMPINIDTVNGFFGLSLQTGEEMEAFLATRRVEIEKIRSAEDLVLSTVGPELYAAFFRDYTTKQWGMAPSRLPRSVTARVPTRASHDDRYFTDTFQMMPDRGYTAMFEAILDHPLIDVRLGVDFADLRDSGIFRRMVYTGPIDEFFGWRLGRLTYRSLRFEHRTLDQEWLQPVGVVNYPGTEPYTRVTEYKHLTGQTHPATSVTWEYPSAEGDPFYPIPEAQNQELYRQYRALADTLPDVWFVGRLGTYQYMNMDQVVAQALTTFGKIEATVGPRRPPRAAVTKPGKAPFRAPAPGLAD